MCVCVAPQLAGGGVEEAARVRGVVELCSVYRRERLCVCVCVCVCVCIGPRKYSENSGLISTKLTLVYSKTDPIFTETKGDQQKSYVT